MDTSENGGDLLYNLACHCETLFDTQLAGVKEHRPPRASLIAEYQQRFAIWAAYLGVFARRSQSLDARLQNHPDVQDLVARLLDLLRLSLQELVRPNEVSSGIDAPRIGDDLQESGGDADNEALAAVEATLTRLNNLGTTIRQSSRDRIDIKAERFAANLDLGAFDAASQAAVQTLYPKAHPSLRQHLSKTMTDRYATMLFTQHRGSTLESRRQEKSYNPMPAIGEEGEAGMPSGDSADQKSGRVLDSPELQRAPASTSLSGLSTINSAVLRQELFGSRNLNSPDERRRGTSSVQVSQANYPRPPFQKGDFTTCEFCGRPIDKRNTTESDWRRHVDEDLKPYTCISEACPHGHPAYSAFPDWFQHMTQCHGGRWHQRVFLTPGWVCVICGDSDAESSYTSPEGLHRHLTETHSDQFRADKLRAISRQSKMERPRRWNECLLCCFPVEEARVPDETTLPKRRGERLRRGSDKVQRRPHDFRPHEGIPNEGIPGNSGGPLDDALAEAEGTTASNNPDIMARHIAVHLQALMLLSIRLSSLQGEESGVKDDADSRSVDIGESEVPSEGVDPREAEDTRSSVDHDPSHETLDHVNMTGDDALIPDADVDFDGVPMQYDELKVEEDAFLQDLISSGVYKYDPQVESTVAREVHPDAKRGAEGSKPLSKETGQSGRIPPLGSNQVGCRTCHYKKLMCQRDPSGLGAACRECAARPSLCSRHSVTELSLYRKQDTPFHLFIRRLMEMELVGFEGWASDETLTIGVSPVSAETPYLLRVRKFIPSGRGMVDAIWHVDGERRRFAVPPYAIASMADAADAVDVAISRGVSRCLKDFTRPNPDRFGDDLLHATYDYAFKYSAQVQDGTVSSLIQKAFRLWVACYLTSDPQRIMGDEVLGMRQAVTDPSSPWVDCYPAPPVMSVQLECVVHTEFLRPLSREVGELLDDLFNKRARDAWLGAYLATFAVLHSCSMLAKRDRDSARQFGFETEYTSPDVVGGLQLEAVNLMTHFHGVVEGPTPLRLAGTGCLGDCGDQWNFTPEQETFMKMTYYQTMRMGFQLNTINDLREPSNKWYWISQLFDEDWSPEKMK